MLEILNELRDKFSILILSKLCTSVHSFAKELSGNISSLSGLKSEPKVALQISGNDNMLQFFSPPKKKKKRVLSVSLFRISNIHRCLKVVGLHGRSYHPRWSAFESWMRLNFRTQNSLPVAKCQESAWYEKSKMQQFPFDQVGRETDYLYCNFLINKIKHY